MGMKMKTLGKYIVSVGAFLSMVGAHTAPAAPPSDSSITPPQLGGYWESKDSFYVEVDGGAVFLNTPNKDNSNFFNRALGGPSIDSQDNVLGSFKTDSTAGSVGGKFGYVIEKQPADSWLGSNLRVEGSGSYFQSGASASGTILESGPLGSSYWVEALDGKSSNVFGIGVAPPTFIGQQNVTEVTNDYFYEAGAAVKSDYNLGGNGEFTITPSLSFDYAHLGQHFQTNAIGLVVADGLFSQAEKINTDYYGLNFGFELRANVSKQFVMFFDGGITPQVAFSNYNGQQAIQPAPQFASTSEANDNTSQFTFQANLDGGFAYDFGPVIVKVSGGFQYWDYVATVKEAELPVGTSLSAPPPSPNSPVQPSHLVSSTMLNPEVNASVIIPF
jgi:hypothetical protein